MSGKTNIEWTDYSWNPIVGCSKCSPVCLNCYAERMACRLAHMNIRAYQDVTEGDEDNWFRRWNGKTEFRPEELKKPLRWKKPRRIFVCSMGDLFHETADFKNILSVFSIMERCRQHTFVVLTKRPQRMLDFCGNYGIGSGNVWPSNIWAGVTTENQKMADERIPLLLRVPAPIHFISVEPMLSGVNIQRYFRGHKTGADIPQGWFRLHGIDWTICGSETGPGARPMAIEWAKSLRDQCVSAKVPFFFKKMILASGQKEHTLNGQTWEQFPEVPHGE